MVHNMAMHPLVTRIDLDAIAHNTRRIKEHVGGRTLMCVIKADAYNHGIDACVPVMEANGADAFGVATFAEAREVARHTSKPVLAWLWAPGEEVPAGIEVGAPSIAHVRSLIDAAPTLPTPIPVHLVVDTGMNRSGIDEEAWEEAFAIAAEAEAAGTLRVKGIMSHLACADQPEHPFTQEQLETFERATQAARRAGLRPEVTHIANSPGVWTRKDAYLDQVRPGVSLYGSEPVAGQDHGLRPAMSWVARVVAVKPIARGESVSYGLTWQAPEDGYTALIPAGYADGISRSWQGRFGVTIGGQWYPQVGRVCMDQIVVWLGGTASTAAAPVRAGDEAVLFGPGGMSADELATATGTISYEVLCAPKGRTVREYVGRG